MDKTESSTRPVYYVSNRPEAYELSGEVGPAMAQQLAQLIAARASRRFRDIAFEIDAEWHVHEPGMERIAAYIDDHLPHWLHEARRQH